MKLALANRSVLVTGASRGIGRAAALAFAGEGCEVHLAGRSVPDLEAMAEQIREISGHPVHVHAGDRMQPGEVDRLARDCRHVDILVNNAGVTPTGPIESVTGAQWREGVKLKVLSAVLQKSSAGI